MGNDDAQSTAAVADSTVDDTGADTGNADAGGSDKSSGGEKSRAYTQSDVDSIVDKVKSRLEAEAAAKINAAKSEEEEKRLAEQGKFKELAEKTQTELERLKADKARQEFVESARAKLAEDNLTEFADVLLVSAETLEEVTQSASTLKSLVDAAVEARVNERLNTGPRAAVSSAAGEPMTPDQMTPEQWQDYKKAHGIRGLYG